MSHSMAACGLAAARRGPHDEDSRSWTRTGARTASHRHPAGYLLCRSPIGHPGKRAQEARSVLNGESAQIEARGVDNIYAVTEAYHGGGLDNEVLAAFGIDNPPPPDLATWHLIK